MLRHLAVVLLVSGLSHAIAAAQPPRVWPDREHVEPAYVDVAGEDYSVRQTITIDPQTKIEARFGITTKGNGSILLPGLAVRIYDAHDDALTFSGGLLRCEWRDEDGDGSLDLVVGGWAEHGADKGRKVKSVPLRAVFRYRPAQRRFEPVICPPEIYTWIPPS